MVISCTSDLRPDPNVPLAMVGMAEKLRGDSNVFSHVACNGIILRAVASFISLCTFRECGADVEHIYEILPPKYPAEKILKILLDQNIQESKICSVRPTSIKVPHM